MARWHYPLGVAALAALLSPAGAGAQGRPFPSHDVRIDVSVLDAAAASVVETYARDADAQDAAFEVLDSPCATVGAVSATVAGRRLTVNVSRRGPWTLIRATDARRERRAIQVRYGVRLEGAGAAVPVVLPAAALEPAGRLRGADVTLRVTFASAIERGAVLLPRLERAGGGVWEARLPAIPSVVRLRLAGGRPAACDRALPGTTGGLEWRFWIFVATMAAWIPIYFWWFGRRNEAG